MDTQALLDFVSRTQSTDNYFLIDQTIQEISKRWWSHPLEEIKRDFPLIWQQVLYLEKNINELALKNDIEGLKEALKGYKKLVLSLIN